MAGLAITVGIAIGLRAGSWFGRYSAEEARA